MRLPILTLGGLSFVCGCAGAPPRRLRTASPAPPVAAVRPCQPAPAPGPLSSLASVEGSYAVTLVATRGAQRGAAAVGTLFLRRVAPDTLWDDGPSALPPRPASPSPRTASLANGVMGRRHLLQGSLLAPIERLGVHVDGAPRDWPVRLASVERRLVDPATTRPIVAAQLVAGGPLVPPDLVVQDGDGMGLLVTEVSGGQIRGTWSAHRGSGDAGGGHFCAQRR